MTTPRQVTGAGTAFAWLGMVLAISFRQTPLKFRAPGITLPLGLIIGRLAFRALNTTEITLAAVPLAAQFSYRPGIAGWALPGNTEALLATQTGLLRPRLDRRAGQIMTGQTPPPSRLHLAYIAQEIHGSVISRVPSAASAATLRNQQIHRWSGQTPSPNKHASSTTQRATRCAGSTRSATPVVC